MTYLNSKRKLLKTPFDKANSSHQKEINRLENFCTEYQKVIQARNNYIVSSRQFVTAMLEQGKITKEDLKPFFKKKRDCNL
jgi:predicted choloylglycine hydrolase